MDTSKIESIISERGYKNFRWISAEDVVVSQWARFKCMFGCPSYGRKGACPPAVPLIEEYREFFKEYEQIAVIHIRKKLDDPEDRKEWSRKTNANLLEVVIVLSLIHIIDIGLDKIPLDMDQRIFIIMCQ